MAEAEKTEAVEVATKIPIRWTKQQNLLFLEAWKKSPDPQAIVDELAKDGVLKSLAQIKTKKKNMKFDAKGQLLSPLYLIGEGVKGRIFIIVIFNKGPHH